MHSGQYKKPRTPAEIEAWIVKPTYDRVREGLRTPNLDHNVLSYIFASEIESWQKLPNEVQCMLSLPRKVVTFLNGQADKHKEYVCFSDRVFSLPKRFKKKNRLFR